MKKSLLLVISFLLTTIFAAHSQSLVTRIFFEGSTIKGLIVEGAFDIQLSQGPKSGVEVNIREDALEKLSVTITENNYIRISFGDDLTKYFVGKKRPLARVVVSSLDYLHLTGNVSLLAKQTFTSESLFTLSMTGGAFAGFLTVQSPKSSVELKGKSKLEDTKITARELITLTAGETATANLEVDCPELHLTCSGATGVTIRGKAIEQLKVTTSGTSRAELLNCLSPMIDAVVMDMSRVNAAVTGQAKLTKSAMGAFRYTGGGTIHGQGAKPL